MPTLIVHIIIAATVRVKESHLNFSTFVTLKFKGIVIEQRERGQLDYLWYTSL